MMGLNIRRVVFVGFERLSSGKKTNSSNNEDSMTLGIKKSKTNKRE